jgi:hypothetical protein
MAKCGYVMKMDIPVNDATPFSLSYGENSNSYRSISAYRQLTSSPDYKWRTYYFVLRNGTVYILQSADSVKSDFHFSIVQITEVKVLDSLLTGKPHSFQITLNHEMEEDESQSENTRTIVVNFLGQPIYETQMQSHSCNCKYTIVLSAPSQAEQESWVRELSSCTSGIKIRDNLAEFGQNSIRFGGKVGFGAINLLLGRKY